MWEVNYEFYELLFVFVKYDCESFEYVGSLCKNGGILIVGNIDLLYILRLYLYSSLKKNVVRYFIVLKLLFMCWVNEFVVDEFVGCLEGKLFSWIDLGII